MRGCLKGNESLHRWLGGLGFGMGIGLGMDTTEVSVAGRVLVALRDLFMVEVCWLVIVVSYKCSESEWMRCV